MSVVAPSTLTLSISATVELEAGYTLEAVKSAFITAVQQYLGTARADGEVKRSKISDLLGGISGVYDHGEVTLDKGGSNIKITQTQLPQVSEDSVTLTEGAVT